MSDYIRSSCDLSLKWSFTKINHKSNYYRAKAASLKKGKKAAVVFDYGYEYAKWYKIKLTKKKKIFVYTKWKETDKMKKMIGLMVILTLVLSLCACGGQPAAEQKTESGAAEVTETTEVTEAASGEVTQADIEKNIVGTWMKYEVDGQPALTNNKTVYTFESTAKVYLSASINQRIKEDADWTDQLIGDVVINNNKISIASQPEEQTTMVHDFIITDINDKEFSADHVSTYTIDGKEADSRADSVRYIKVFDDFSDDVIGTWEGRCTSVGSVFDDGQDHRWEYKDDGTFVYYIKVGDDWVPSEDTMNKYFVAGNLLCTRWMDSGEEKREWWEISIDGDKMNWTALREDEDGKRFTATFEMTKVEE